MSNSNVSDTILEAIDIISSQRVNNAKYDKTIQGVVLQCVDATIGKYKIKYQDSIFIAYSENTSVSYSKGTSVYILVPNSDMTKTKTIIGAVKKLGTNFIQVYDLQERYNLIGSNIITNNLTQGLCSYTQNQIITLYNYQSSNNSVTVDTTFATEYLTQSDLIVVSMNVRNSLDESQRYLGNYGLIVQADFINQTIQNQEVTRSFTLDIDNFTGNPYLYTFDTEQRIAFEIDGKNFVRIRSISLFSKDFPNSAAAGTKPNDIFISNINIQGALAFTTNELNSSTLALTTPRGYIFDKSDAATDYRTIEASVRIKGKKANAQTQGINFYWFIEDSSITTHSIQYMKEAGQGWRCLNEYNIISDNAREYIPGDYIYTVKKQDIFTKNIRYKCLAIYSDEKSIVLSRQIQIINFDAGYNITLESDLGVDFYKDIGTPTLTCKCLKKNQSGNYQQVTNLGIRYVWSMTSNAGVFESLSTQGSTFYSNSNTLQIDVSRIINFSVFRCSVFLTLNGTSTFIGTAALTISNYREDNNNTYYLVINNGSQLFKYSTTGVSPASPQLDDPIKIKALSFNLFDNRGTEVDIYQKARIQIVWTVPIQNSMLDIKTQYSPGEDSSTGIISDMTEIVYEIKDFYSSYYTNNQIKLSVTYDGKTLLAKTNFTFIKEGQSGTNGTDYVLKIVPDISNFAQAPQYPTLTRINQYIYPNWSDIFTTGAIRFDLWHNGDLIYSSRYTSGNTSESKAFSIQSCEILGNNYGNNYTDREGLILNNYGNYYSLNINSSYLNTGSFFTTPLAAIVKAVGVYEGMEITTTLPVCIGYISSGNTNNKIFLKEGTGFNKVLYNQSGLRPMYDSRNPFEIEIIENGQTVTNLSNFTFNWNCVGSVWSKLSNTWREETENYLIKESNQTGAKVNQVFIKPANHYTGECVTAGLVCRVYKSGSLFGFLYIPVHLMLNKYFNSAINGWDGNSVELGQSNGGMILAPQIGAGIKDSGNTFTGIVMGTAKDPQETSSIGYDVGLFGYYRGRRSIFLDANTGKAFFGVSGQGQIQMDPSQGTAIIQSGNYNTSNKKGMRIDLTTPSIQFGSGNFSVNSDGILTTKSAVIEGQVKITNENNGKITLPKAGWDKDYLWLGGYTANTAAFSVSSTDGSIKITKGSLNLGDGSFQVDNNGNVTISRGSIKIGGTSNTPNFYVDSSGNVTLRTATITGYLKPEDVGANGTTTISGNRITTGTVAAKYLELTEYAKFTDLSDDKNTTIINGANIRTGTIKAERLELTNYAKFTDLQTKGSTKINGDNITTGTIQAERLELSSYAKTADLSTAGKTVINGANITTGTITSSGDDPNFSVNLNTGQVTIKTGTISLNYNSSYSNYGIVLDSNGLRMGLAAGSGSNAKYNFVAYSTGTLNLDYNTTYSDWNFKASGGYIKLGLIGSNNYAFTVNNQGQISLKSTDTSRSAILQSGLICFNLGNDEQKAKILYKTESITLADTSSLGLSSFNSDPDNFNWNNLPTPVKYQTISSNILSIQAPIIQMKSSQVVFKGIVYIDKTLMVSKPSMVMSGGTVGKTGYLVVGPSNQVVQLGISNDHLTWTTGNTTYTLPTSGEVSAAASSGGGPSSISGQAISPSSVTASGTVSTSGNISITSSTGKYYCNGHDGETKTSYPVITAIEEMFGAIRVWTGYLDFHGGILTGYSIDSKYKDISTATST